MLMLILMQPLMLIFPQMLQSKKYIETYFVYLLVLILELEAETLPESRSFHAAPAHMGLEGWFYENYRFLNPGRVEIPQTFSFKCCKAKSGSLFLSGVGADSIKIINLKAKSGPEFSQTSG